MEGQERPLTMRNETALLPESSGGLTGIKDPGSERRCVDPDACVRHLDRDHLSRANLAGLARFGLAIDQNVTIGHQGLGGATAVRDSGGFQQGIKGNELAAELEIDQVHGPDRTPCTGRFT